MLDMEMDPGRECTAAHDRQREGTHARPIELELEAASERVPTKWTKYDASPSVVPVTVR